MSDMTFPSSIVTVYAKTCLLVVGILIGCGVEPTQAQTDTKLYWYDADLETFRRANPDGDEIETILSERVPNLRTWTLHPTEPIVYGSTNDRLLQIPLDGAPKSTLLQTDVISPTDVAITPAYVYWHDRYFNDIRRSNHDGSEVLIIANNVDCSRIDIEVDWNNGEVYWSDECQQKIERTDLDGSNRAELITAADGLGQPSSFVLDLVHEYMYWVDCLGRKIQRARLTGENIEDLVTEGIETPEAANGLALDVVAGKLYWTDIVVGISRANLDGTDAEVLIADLDIPLDDDPYSIQLDLVNRRMYWLDVEKHILASAHLDGTDFHVELTQAPGRNLTLHDGYFYWSNGRILRSAVDDELFEPVVENRKGFMYNLALDPLTSTLFWGDTQNVYSFALTTEAETILAPIETLGRVIAIAFDAQREHIYAATWPGVSRLDRNDGTVTLLTDQRSSAEHIALDLHNRWVYWATSTQIYRMNMEGTDVEVIIDSASQLQGLAVDGMGHTLYWIDGGSQTIRRAQLDGANPEVLVTEGNPHGLALASTAGIIVDTESTEQSFELALTSYPNPFLNEVTLRYELPQPSLMQITVYDVLGRVMYTQQPRYQHEGVQHVRVSTQGWASGLYMAQLVLGAKNLQAPLLLVR